MVNHSENIWSESSKAHTEEKRIALESTLSEGQGLENALERKGDKVCKEKDDLWKNKRPFFLSGVVVPDNLFNGKIQKFWNG